MTLRKCVVCGHRTALTLSWPRLSGGSTAGELAVGAELCSGACHSTGPLIIPSLPCFNASKGLEVHALGGPDATLEAPAVSPM